MYRDDEEAARARADAATAEAERLRRENQAMREAMTAAQRPQYANPYAMQPMTPMGMVPTYPAHIIYKCDVRTLPIEERARLAQHTLTSFPTALTVILTILTFGLFPWIHLSLKHDSLPKAALDDPGAGKAIGFHFIPFYNLYWIFFNSLRLVARLDLQLKLRGLPPTAPRGMVMAACIVNVIPYIGGLTALLILWPIAAGMLQHTVNKVAALPATSFDATPSPAWPAMR